MLGRSASGGGVGGVRGRSQRAGLLQYIPPALGLLFVKHKRGQVGRLVHTKRNSKDEETAGNLQGINAEQPHGKKHKETRHKSEE